VDIALATAHVLHNAYSIENWAIRHIHMILILIVKLDQ